MTAPLYPTPSSPGRRRLLKTGSLVLLIGAQQIAHGAGIVAVRIWPAEDYSRVTIESDTTPAGLAVSHFDFYRFADPREWEDAGLRDLFAAPGLKLAEWPEHAAPLLPTADLTLRLDVDADERRRVHLVAGTRVGEQLLQELRA